MNKIKEYNLTRGNLYYEDKKPRRKLPRELADKLMKESAMADYAKGGFGCRCEKCGVKYGQSFLVYCYLGSFREGYVCRECWKKYNLQKA